ncbi:MAG: RNA polymerase sigma factor [Oscillospiraceae bacterium]|nr:RNA polymerase sigma factor [Oscillospiraceae bacterium]
MYDKLADRIAKHHGTVYRVAIGYVKNVHDAEDITQEVFLKLCTRFKDRPDDGGFPTESDEKFWLIRVTVNQAKNLLKSSWLKNRNDLDEGIALPEQPDISELELSKYIKQLKPHYRTVIYLHYFEEYTAKEIATLLDKPHSTIQTQLQRARESLKKILVKEGISYEE